MLSAHRHRDFRKSHSRSLSETLLSLPLIILVQKTDDAGLKRARGYEKFSKKMSVTECTVFCSNGNIFR